MKKIISGLRAVGILLAIPMIVSVLFFPMIIGLWVFGTGHIWIAGVEIVWAVFWLGFFSNDEIY